MKFLNNSKVSELSDHVWLVMLLTRIEEIWDAISPFKAMLPAKLQMCIKVKISFFNERFSFAMFLLLGEKKNIWLLPIQNLQIL